MDSSAFVVKYGDKYCRFGSYRECALVDTPLKASIYARSADAKRRAGREHYVGYETVNGSQGKVTNPLLLSFKVVKISATFTEEDV